MAARYLSSEGDPDHDPSILKFSRIEEVEDTPVFQERVAYLEGQMKQNKEEVKALIAYAGAYSHAGNEYAEAGKAFAAKAEDFGRVMPAMQSVASGLKNLHSLLQMMTTQVTNDIVKPLEAELGEIRGNKTLKASMDSAADDFYSSLNKSLTLRSDADPHITLEADREAMRRKGRYALLRLEYLSKLTDLSARRHRRVGSFFTQIVNKQVWLMRAGLSALEGAVPPLFSHDTQGDDASQELSQRQAMRLQLVTSHIAEQEALLRRDADGSMPKGPSMGVQRSPAGAGAPPVDRAVHEMRGWLGKVGGSRGRQTKDLRNNRYWAVLSAGKLFLYRNWRASPKYTIDLLLCTVKEARGPERFCFEIISPSSSRMLQAENLLSMQRWMAVIHNATGRLLDAQVPGNAGCVDCGAEGPEWASISLGALMCLQCSGVHRALGVHVSRVRSLHLDVWEESLMDLLSAMGNAKVNNVYLARCEQDPRDPLVWADGDFIRRKYALRAFVEQPGNATPDHLSQSLTSAVRSQQLQKVLLYLSQGADVNARCGSSSDAAELSPLAHAVRAGGVSCMELLLQNGADVAGTDSQGRTALHHAALGDLGACAELLLARGASPEVVDALGQTPLEVSAHAPGGAVFEAIVRSQGKRVATHEDEPVASKGNSPFGPGL
ncbi:hypothetical protein T484DRAFT_1770542 [Baffinella frigidus]|nr:hypothetical protein T484DRAFT_1770542 [Cryptophyta sp. CCMP2293]